MRTLIVLLPAACLSLAPQAAPGAPAGAAGQEHKPGSSRTYTNEDLARLSAQRGETGVLSQPAVSTGLPGQRPARSSAGGVEAREMEADHARLAAAERLWRREAESLRRRQLPLRERLASLRASLEEQQSAAETSRRRPGRLGSREAADARTRTLQDRIAALEDRLRNEQAMLEERARRAGALPGWLR